ncbi:MAG: hypothetical protein ACI8PB_004013 [Desulforhopalus sp.]|jgi:hypothetical protein
MLKNALVAIMMTLFLVGPSTAADFNCDLPPFGASLDTMSNDGKFIKYKEKKGVSYYNYTGTCELPIHQRVNPAVSYGFVEGKLFAKIVTYSVAGVNTGQSSTFRDFLKAKYPQLVSNTSKKVEGDWDVYKVKMEDRDVTIKYKYNRVLELVKSSWYYTPLRKRLNELNGTK